ncbi:hypothetical protein ENSA5_19580 [Enhygromyxa salina]|uniref:Uncharacterized protein n=1 Tax=Enhygromyxa salina TaxID=215803 RepID=A0A2S9YD36_9BACT|nr:hypothetical protein [Enhygromyxa salina]PRQ03019.1 hypothetical protein ENSA5_19580 [Enhygromyxa salina]
MISPRSLISVFVLTLGLSLADRPVHACGPDLPRAMLQRDHDALCQAPALRLGPQLARLAPAKVRARANTSTTAEAEQLDLRVALAGLGLDAAELEARLVQVRDYRAQLEDPDRDGEPALELPELPEEFRLYLEGARAWHRERGQARSAFAAILELPADRRRYRSVWAAYMLARLDEGPGCRAWPRVRALADAGFVDSLGLAAASYGEEAACERGRDPTRALELYLDQVATGDGSAQASIEFVLADEFDAAIDAPARLRALVAKPALRELVGAWLVADGEPEHSAAWLEALEVAGLEQAVAAGPLAWTAYRVGDMDAAARWARLGASDLDHGDVIARWVLAKLELRRGDLDRATLALARIERDLGEAERATLELGEWRYGDWMSDARAHRSAAAELGVLELRRGRFVPALAAFVRADAYLDAAYVAEQVLTIDELELFVSEALASEPSPSVEDLRWLLARRLARSGQWERAAPYYPEQWRAKAEAHAADLQALRDPDLSELRRARILWRMAQRTREHGMELRGTELDPDWTTYAGAFAPEAIWATRGLVDGPTGPSESERERVEAQRLTEPRFHYRWVAADLAWDAAELLPEEHPAAARVLCIAGAWIADRDLEGGHRFHAAMTRRSGPVDVAYLADGAGWFADTDPCAAQGVDLGQATVHIPFGASPRARSSLRDLVRVGWPIAALFALLSVVGLMLIPARQPKSPK